MLRIFVSHALSDERQGREITARLISDLRASGAEVVTDNARITNEAFVQFLADELPRCQYLVLVQTPAALRSLRVQAAVNTALNLVAQQRMRGVLRLIATSEEAQEEQPLWVSPRAFDASLDYARARDKMLLELGLLSLDDEAEEPPDILQTLPGAGSRPHPELVDDLYAPGDITFAPYQTEFLPEATGTAPAVQPRARRRWRLGNRAAERSKPRQKPLLPDRPQPVNRPGLRLPLWGTITSLLLIAMVILAVSVVSLQARGKQPGNVTPTRISTPTHFDATPATTIPGLSPAVNAAMLSTQDPYGAGGSLVLNNPLSVQDNSPYQWHVSPASHVHGCHFKNGAYDMLSVGLNYCLAANTDFADFVYQIEATIVQGRDTGIVFRANDARHFYYRLQISIGGHYSVFRSAPGHPDTLLAFGTSPAIKQNLRQPNLLAVEAQGSSLSFFINLQRVAEAHDSAYTTGNIGVEVGKPGETSPTEVTFRYAKVWAL